MTPPWPRTRGSPGADPGAGGPRAGAILSLLRQPAAAAAARSPGIPSQAEEAARQTGARAPAVPPPGPSRTKSRPRPARAGGRGTAAALRAATAASVRDHGRAGGAATALRRCGRDGRRSQTVGRRRRFVRRQRGLARLHAKADGLAGRRPPPARTPRGRLQPGLARLPIFPSALHANRRSRPPPPAGRGRAPRPRGHRAFSRGIGPSARHRH